MKIYIFKSSSSGGSLRVGANSGVQPGALAPGPGCVREKPELGRRGLNASAKASCGAARQPWRFSFPVTPSSGYVVIMHQRPGSTPCVSHCARGFPSRASLPRLGLCRDSNTLTASQRTGTARLYVTPSEPHRAPGRSPDNNSCPSWLH